MRPTLLLLVAAVVTGCGRSGPPAPAGGAPAAAGPVLVKVTRPAIKPVRWAIEQPATVQPFQTVPIVAKVSGPVKAIAADPNPPKGTQLPAGQPAVIDIGSAVGPNQLLATVDVPELVAAVEEKRAEVARAAAERRQAEADRAVAESLVSAAQKMVKQAEAGIARAEADITLWTAQLAETQAQVKTGTETSLNASVITKSLNLAKAARVEAEAAVQTALAQEKVAQARRDRAASEVKVAKARVGVAGAALKTAQALEAYTRVTAPFAGVVTARHVHPGHLLQPAGSGPGTALFQLARTDVVRVFADVPEVNADRAGVGTAATVRVPALGGREYPGTVTRTTGIVDPGTRTLRVEIDLANPDGALRAGLYATVRIDAEASAATVLPAACVLPADETHYVYLVEAGKAVKYRVQLGRSDAGAVQVLGRRRATASAGAWDTFAGTEQVVEGNLGALADGADVRTE